MGRVISIAHASITYYLSHQALTDTIRGFCLVASAPRRLHPAQYVRIIILAASPFNTETGRRQASTICDRPGTLDTPQRDPSSVCPKQVHTGLERRTRLRSMAHFTACTANMDDLDMGIERRAGENNSFTHRRPVLARDPVILRCELQRTRDIGSSVAPHGSAKLPPTHNVGCRPFANRRA